MYRTIDKAHALVKQADPNTAITKYYIRKLAVQNQVRTLNTGKKVLVDIISLQEVLNIALVKSNP